MLSLWIGNCKKHSAPLHVPGTHLQPQLTLSLLCRTALEMLAGDEVVPDYRPPSRRGKAVPATVSTPLDSPTKSPLGQSQEGAGAGVSPIAAPHLTDLPLQIGLEKEHSTRKDAH